MAIDVNLGLSAAATGTVDVITATYSPAPTLVDRKILFLRTAGTNTTTTPTFNPNGLGAKTIVKQGGAALVAGDLVGDVVLMYNATSTQWELLNPRVRNLGTTAGTVAAGDDSRFDKDKTIALTITPSSHTGNTTETVKYTVSIPANTFTTGDRIYHEILLTAIGTAGVKTIKTYINTTADLTGSPVLISTYFTNHLAYSLLSSFFVDSNSSMKSYKSGIVNSATYLGSSNSSLGTFSIDWTVQQYLVLSVQLANAADLIKLEALIFKRERI